MKKTYINPELTLIRINEMTMIASSPLGLRNGEAEAEGEVLVKESRNSGYSVWDDDWSE